MPQHKVYIIAEIGINHNGSLKNCFRLIDSAVEAGCDAVKFQLFRARYLYPKNAGLLNWQNKKESYSYNIYKAVKNFEMSEYWIKDLMQYCRERKIDFLCSAFDQGCTDLLIKNGVRRIKLSSYSVTNIPLIRYCAKQGLQIILSTGGATLGEINEAVSTILQYHHKLSLLHCSLSYPVRLKDCNLGVIQTLRHAFTDIPIGLSDHTAEVSCAAVQAVYLGAKLIEKHITLDKKMSGPDHFFALQPQELKQMVKDIKNAESKYRKGIFKIDKIIYGNSTKTLYPQEKYLRDFCFTTIFAAKNIKQGQRINYGDLCLLRPGRNKRGLEPKYLPLFKQFKIYAVQNIAKEESISWDKIFNA